MRQIKSFMNLVLHLLKITEFELHKDNARSVKLNINLFEMKMFGTDGTSITISHSDGNVIHFFNDNISNKNLVTISVHKFGSPKLQHSCIDLDIEDKHDYFNYVVQNDPGKLTLDDISVLKEIRELALKVFDNEKTIQ